MKNNGSLSRNTDNAQKRALSLGVAVADLQAAAQEAADCLFMTLAPFPVDEARNLKAARRLLAAAERVLSDEAIVTAAERSGAIVLEGFTVDMLRQFAKELMK